MTWMKPGPARACGLALTILVQTLLVHTILVTAVPAVAEERPAPPDLGTPPAGHYVLDPSHASLVFRISHLGLSRYTGRFARFDASLDFDPAAPAAARITATVDARSLALESPPDGFVDSLLGSEWLDAAAHPVITFRSTSVERTGTSTARVTGAFTLHGVTAPVVLDVTFNGGYAGHPMERQARIGFSATATLRRSVFGITAGIPAPGTTLGVGDLIDVAIEAEFTGPPLAPAPQP